MAQRWVDLLFAHWPVPLDVLRARVPASLSLDAFDGTAWVSCAPFRITHLRPRGVPPLPWVSSFPELNVRTYVTRNDKPGVYFFSLDAGNPLAVAGARAFYHLPYFNASMRVRSFADGAVDYHSRRRGATAEFRAAYRSTGERVRADPGSLEHWLTERYCLYAVDARERAYRADIHHLPWPLERATVDIAANTVPDAAGLAVRGPPRLPAFSPSIDVLVWWPERLP